MTCPAHQLAETRRMLTADDVDLIRFAATMLAGAPVVVDLGAGSGTTAAAVFAERPEACVFTFDVDPEAVGWAERFVGSLGDVFWVGLVSDSAEAARIFADDTVDLLMIDSSHEYEQTVAEIAAWRPRMVRRGLVWFHDYVGEYPGVTRAVDEAVARGELEIIAQRGLGILTRVA